MSTVRFRAGEIDLELSGSESFVNRQLKKLTPLLGNVDSAALGVPAPVETGFARTDGDDPAPVVSESRPANGRTESTEDGVSAFYRSIPPQGDTDRQADAALLFAYYLQRREGLSSLRLGDLIRCCIRAGVDTRNFNRSLAVLANRGYLETVQQGHSYRLSEQGARAVESRM